MGAVEEYLKRGGLIGVYQSRVKEYLPKILSNPSHKLHEHLNIIIADESSDEEKLAALLLCREHIDHVLENKADFDIDYFKFMEAISFIGKIFVTQLQADYLYEQASLVSCEEYEKLKYEFGNWVAGVIADEKISQHNKGAKRRTDLLSSLIREIVREQPKISCTQLIDELRKYEKQEVSFLENKVIIEYITDDSIEWIDAKGKAQDTPLTALRSRLSRIKKSL